MKSKGQKQSSNNAFSKLGVFHTATRFSASVPMGTTIPLLKVDIIPTLDLFPLQYKNFQNYRIQRVDYQLIPRYNIATMPGSLPIIYSIPLSSPQIPAATTSAFLGFPNCRVSQLHRTFTGSFVPVAYATNVDSGSAVRSPLLKTT